MGGVYRQVYIFLYVWASLFVFGEEWVLGKKKWKENIWKTYRYNGMFFWGALNILSPYQ